MSPQTYRYQFATVTEEDDLLRIFTTFYMTNIRSTGSAATISITPGWEFHRRSPNWGCHRTIIAGLRTEDLFLNHALVFLNTGAFTHFNVGSDNFWAIDHLDPLPESFMGATTSQ